MKVRPSVGLDGMGPGGGGDGFEESSISVNNLHHDFSPFSVS